MPDSNSNSNSGQEPPEGPPDSLGGLEGSGRGLGGLKRAPIPYLDKVITQHEQHTSQQHHLTTCQPLYLYTTSYT